MGTIACYGEVELRVKAPFEKERGRERGLGRELNEKERTVYLT